MATIRWYVMGGFNNFVDISEGGTDDDHYPFDLLCAYVDTPGTIVWTPTWTPVASDPAPTMEAPYGPVPGGDYSPGGTGQPFAQGVGFQFGSGSDYGTLVLTCTVDGIPCDNVLVAAVAVGSGMYADLSWSGLSPVIGWFDDIHNFSSESASTTASGTESMASPHENYYAGVVGYIAGDVVWNSEWTPAVASDPPVVTPDSNGRVGVSSDGFPIKYGTLLLTATVSGVAAEGTLRIVFTDDGGAFSYGSAAWERIVATIPSFWADFSNTYEVI